MSSRARRVLALTGVVALHAGVLLIVLEEARTKVVRAAADSPSLLVMLLSALEPQHPSGARSSRGAAARHRPATSVPPEAPAPDVPTGPRSTIDWFAAAKDEAARQVEANEQRQRQARAFALPPNMFTPPAPKRPGFHWDYAATHRVEAVPGGATVIHLNDSCALVLFIIIPMIGCALEKPAVRGDLFDHMHDGANEAPLP
ncbi:MAG TPA: hypothetical protein VNX02_12585 [Steroidobacteraceae bacterium]|jgi:hypothetical protein|nr:hypothetical protein [Steroidobacteraceae bacterium]